MFNPCQVVPRDNERESRARGRYPYRREMYQMGEWCPVAIKQCAVSNVGGLEDYYRDEWMPHAMLGSL